MSYLFFRVTGFLALISFFSCSPGTKENQLPNIVYILADDLGYGDVSAYNPESKIQTPAIDRLASEGMMFMDAHSPSSVCTPTRYGILTGRYPWRSRLPTGVLRGYGQALIEAKELTVAELLKQKGYTTGVVGKWHLGLDWVIRDEFQDSIRLLEDLPILTEINSDWINFNVPPQNGPLSHGFDYSYILPASLDMDPYCYLENDVLTELPDAYTPGNDLDAPSWATGAFWRAGRIAKSFDFHEVLPTFVNKAVGFIADHKDKETPFFLYLPLAAPHTPWVPTDDFNGKSNAGQYGDFVQMVDTEVGRLLKYLDDNNLSKNTIVFFTSDNGPYWRPEFIEQFNHRAASIYRGMKADIWEGGHRIPFIVRWPGHVESGTQSQQITTLTNLMATLAEITGAKKGPTDGMDSYSIFPALHGSEPDNAVPIIHHSSRGYFAIRQENWKYIEGLGSGGFSQPAIVDAEEGMPAGQLYDMSLDAGEQNNLIKENAEKASELLQLLNTVRGMEE